MNRRKLCTATLFYIKSDITSRSDLYRQILCKSQFAAVLVNVSHQKLQLAFYIPHFILA